MKVLIVDDSIVYRSSIRKALSTVNGIEIVAAMSNGSDALNYLENNLVDVMTLDLEMPVLDGISTLKGIKALKTKNPLPKVIVFTSSSHKGSETALDALSLGAADFVAKPSASSSAGSSPHDWIREQLVPKILQFDKSLSIEAKNGKIKTSTPLTARDVQTFRPHCIVIASSTGGPAAVEKIFTGIGGTLRIPILIAQHMPPVFTTSFAKRLAEVSKLPCEEATHNAPLENRIYVAPGDFHLTIAKQNGAGVLLLDKSPLVNSVRPAADKLFISAAEYYTSRCMGFVLTGMGEDGLEGAKKIRSSNGGIMIQSKESCVVFGMPGAVFEGQHYDGIGDLEMIRNTIIRMAL